MPNNPKRINQVKEQPSSQPKSRKAKIIASDNPDSVVHLRSLTVSSSFIPPSDKYGYNRTGKSVPFIRLTGKWLEEAGFPISSKVDVIVENNLLIIKPAVL